VSVTLTGIQAAQGDLYIALQTQEQFMKQVGSYGEIVRLPAAGDKTVVLTGVKAGDYAVQVWHDINNDHRFNTAPNGKPTDGYAMVNAETLRAVPTFDQVKLAVPADGKAVTLPMVYAR
jgi:uncharacterized protein (DUF2141 family)